MYRKQAQICPLFPSLQESIAIFSPYIKMQIFIAYDKNEKKLHVLKRTVILGFNYCNNIKLHLKNIFLNFLSMGQDNTYFPMSVNYFILMCYLISVSKDSGVTKGQKVKYWVHGPYSFLHKSQKGGHNKTLYTNIKENI